MLCSAVGETVVRSIKVWTTSRQWALCIAGVGPACLEIETKQLYYGFWKTFRSRYTCIFAKMPSSILVPSILAVLNQVAWVRASSPLWNTPINITDFGVVKGRAALNDSKDGHVLNWVCKSFVLLPRFSSARATADNGFLSSKTYPSLELSLMAPTPRVKIAGPSRREQQRGTTLSIPQALVLSVRQVQTLQIWLQPTVRARTV